MKRIKHWTPRYVFNRLRVLGYERLHPQVPWLTRDMIELLNSRLTAAHHGLEWGAGRSTLWLAARVASLLSVEHNDAYYCHVRSQLDEKGLHNVDLRYCPEENAYVAVVDSLPPNSLDFVLVDGVVRDRCALAALSRLQAGGLLVLDNANWYLPCSSHAPNSRRPQDGPASPAWEQFAEEVKGWRRRWTTNGVWDTAFWEKPG